MAALLHSAVTNKQCYQTKIGLSIGALLEHVASVSDGEKCYYRFIIENKTDQED